MVLLEDWNYKRKAFSVIAELEARAVGRIESRLDHVIHAIVESCRVGGQPAQDSTLDTLELSVSSCINSMNKGYCFAYLARGTSPP